MRPLRLEVEGLTAFADRTVVDFAPLQLFAITGTTGAGKSSLIDALLLALFGRVPRTPHLAQLLTHGKSQINVLLEFEARGERYRIGRTFRAKSDGLVQKAQFERVTANGTLSIASKTSEIEPAMVRLIGIDYEAFTRSVVLPQGQFDEFLRGDPKDRRRILVDLLDLARYERMARVCGERQRELQAKRDALEQRLRDDYAGASKEQLAAVERDLDAATAHATTLAERGTALAQLAQLAAGADAARRELAQGQAARGLVLRQHAEATAGLQALQQAAATFDADRARLEAELAAATVDPTRLPLLTRAASALPLLLRALGDEAQAQRDLDASKARRTQCEQELAAATAQTPTLQAAVQAHEAELAAAEAELEAQQTAHAAAHLRAQLQPGQPCPVCDQSVAQVPAALPLDLDGHKAAVKGARDLLQRAQHKLHDAQRTQSQRADALPELQQLERRAEDRKKKLAADIAQQQTELQAAGMALPSPPTTAAAQRLATSVAAELQVVQAATTTRQTRQQALDALLQRNQAAQAERERTRGRADALAAQLRDHDAALAIATTAADAAAAAFRSAAKAAAIDDNPLDAAVRLQQLTREHARAVQDAAQQRGELAARRTQLQRAIEQAQKLQQELVQLADAAALHKAMALLLRGDRFQDYVLESAVQRLCRDGSERLALLSAGRYGLANDGGDFVVVDRWNADRTRSVRTLSGGETFLASLALSLALADGIRAFAAAEAANSAFDCLFVDEGFGSLDGEALEAAVQALEALQGQSRMVGIVTHLQALAERLPARLHVDNRAGRARVVAS